MREKETLSLNELVVKQEREDRRREEFDAENMRLALKGLPLEEWKEDEDAEEDSTELVDEETILVGTEEEIEEEEEEEGDPLILESGRILVDFISLS